MPDLPLQEITDQLVSAVLGGKKKSFSYPCCCHKYAASPGCIIGKNEKGKKNSISRLTDNLQSHF